VGRLGGELWKRSQVKSAFWGAMKALAFSCVRGRIFRGPSEGRRAVSLTKSILRAFSGSGPAWPDRANPGTGLDRFLGADPGRANLQPLFRLYSINRELNRLGYAIGQEISTPCGRLIAILGAILLPSGRTLPTQAVAPCRPL
jgi:hypothetical protein